MKNDENTEQRRQWVSDQQEYTMEDVDYQLQFDPQAIKNEAAGLAYLRDTNMSIRRQAERAEDRWKTGTTASSLG